MIVILGLVLLVTVAYKPIYAAAKAPTTIQQASFGETEATWQNCFGEMVQVIPDSFSPFSNAGHGVAQRGHFDSPAVSGELPDQRIDLCAW